VTSFASLLLFPTLGTLIRKDAGCPTCSWLTDLAIRQRGPVSLHNWRYDGLTVAAPYTLEAPELIRAAAHGSVLSGAL
jgi:hypothetical protein